MAEYRLNKGFTLIELLLVMAIFMVIASSSAAFFSNFILQNAVGNTQDQLVGQLRKAQIYAMMGKSNSGWGVNLSGNTLTLFQGSTFASRTVAFDEVFVKNMNVTVSGLTEIDFAKTTGLPNTTASISISGIGSTKTVTVNSQGVVSR